MPETCNSRSLSWLVGSCIPKSPADLHVHTHPHTRTRTRTRTRPASSEPEPEPSPEPPISSLPDDLLLACLARAPLSSLPAVSAACRRFSLLLSSPHFFPLRRSLSPLSPSLFSPSLLSDAQTLIAAVHSLDSSAWRISSFPFPDPIPIPIPHPSSFVSINNAVFAIGRGPANIRLDTWTARISVVPPTLTPRRKFAAAAVGGKIYVAGGSSRNSTVEIYDPEAGAWEVVGDSPTRRYGCIGAGAGEIFYVAGGLRVGAAADARTAHAAAGTVDAYSVRTGCWARGARAVPGGGCIVGACGVGPSLYVIASNAVELTLWRWEWEERGGKRTRGGGGGEWVPLEPPPVQGRVGLGGAVRFSCCAVGEGRMAAAVHVSSARGGGGQNGDFGGSSVEGAVLLYDVTTGEWSRGPDLPAGFRRAGLVCVEC